MSIFSDFNPFSKRRAEDAIPSSSDCSLLEEIVKFERVTQITNDVALKFEKISDGIDEVMEYNGSLDTDDENDYRLVIIEEPIITLFYKAKEKIDILQTGGVTEYKKNRLKQLLEEFPCAPKDFIWESEYIGFYPEDYNRKLKPKGNWILILEDESIVSAPKKYSIHYATPVTKKCTAFGGGYKYWYASIIVNNKEVLMHPREYIIIHDANMLLEMVDKGIKMIEGSKSAKLDKNKVFYLKSRGFNQSDIYKILFKSISSKGFCHFQADGDFAYLIDGAKRGIDPNFMIKIQNHRDNLPTIKFNAIC